MSVKIMTLVFEASIPDLKYTKKDKKRIAKASTIKLLLLAYADHANDEGEAAYPGYTRLELKTALSRQGISDTLEAIRQHGFMVHKGKSKRHTGIYEFNIKMLEALVKPLDRSSHLTSTSQATLPVPVKPLDLNHPLTILESSSYGEKELAIEKPSEKANGKRDVKADLLPSTEGGKLIMLKLTQEQNAKGRGAVKYFESLAQKQTLEAAEARLGQAEFEKALQKALETGITQRARIVNYIVKWNPNRTWTQPTLDNGQPCLIRARD